MASIPFENLDIVLGRGIEVDLASVQRKLDTFQSLDASGATTVKGFQIFSITGFGKAGRARPIGIDQGGV